MFERKRQKFTHWRLSPTILNCAWPALKCLLNLFNYISLRLSPCAKFKNGFFAYGDGAAVDLTPRCLGTPPSVANQPRLPHATCQAPWACEGPWPQSRLYDSFKHYGMHLPAPAIAAWSIKRKKIQQLKQLEKTSAWNPLRSARLAANTSCILALARELFSAAAALSCKSACCMKLPTS